MASDDGLKAQRRKRRSRLAQYASHPDIIFDIGASRGTAWLYNAFPETQFVLIDPLEEAGEQLAARELAIRYEFLQIALSDSNGGRTLNVPLAEADSPLLALTGFHERIDDIGKNFSWTEPRTVTTATLDSVAEKYEGRLGLKIDTEGHELAVLKGARETLKRADFVILEVSVTHRFEDTVPPSRIIAELATHGLELRDVLATSYPPADLPRHMDLLFTPW